VQPGAARSIIPPPTAHAKGMPKLFRAKEWGVTELKGTNGWARPVNGPVGGSSARSPNSACAVSVSKLAKSVM
jgi:hypothetical protein